jgi:regulation of enolase protein 1 (concanavalin A-like superfamily)
MRRFFLLALVAGAAFAAGPPREEPDSEPGQPFYKPGWDRVADVAMRRRIAQTKDALTVTLPAEDHDFDTKRKKYNAPRLMREVKGDFTLVVRVRGDFHATEKSTDGKAPAYSAAGIFLAGENKEKTRIRFLFGKIRKGEERSLIRHSWGHLRNPGTALGTWHDGHKNWPLKPGASEAWLRVIRRGDKLPGEVSADGKTWTKIADEGIVGLPATMKVGLVACSTSGKTLRVTFDRFSLTQP